MYLAKGETMQGVKWHLQRYQGRFVASSAYFLATRPALIRETGVDGEGVQGARSLCRRIGELLQGWFSSVVRLGEI